MEVCGSPFHVVVARFASLVCSFEARACGTGEHDVCLLVDTTPQRHPGTQVGYELACCSAPTLSYASRVLKTMHELPRVVSMQFWLNRRMPPCLLESVRNQLLNLTQIFTTPQASVPTRNLRPLASKRSSRDGRLACNLRPHRLLECRTGSPAPIRQRNHPV